MLTEGAIMIALATVLSFIVIYHLPWGGSITLLSMLPICIYGIKYGMKRGLLVSFIFSVIQLFQGISEGLFGWGLTPAALIGCIFLDYIIAFSVIGLSGMFRNKGLVGWVGGIVVALLIRYLCHYLSGAIIFGSCGLLWEGFSTENIWLYSFLYNGSFMLPETVFTAIGAFILLKVPQTKKLLTIE